MTCYVYVYLCCSIFQLRMDEHYGHQINNYFSEDNVAGFGDHIFGHWMAVYLAPVFRRVANAIHWINIIAIQRISVK